MRVVCQAVWVQQDSRVGCGLAAEVLLFDFWGVIGVVQSDDEVAQMAAILDVPYADFVAAYWVERHDYDAGAAAETYWQRVAARLGVEMEARLLAELVERDTGSWRRVDPAMVHLLAELAAEGRRMALLSNAPRELAGFVRTSAAGQYLDPLIFSCDLGLAKPDAAIYAAALRMLDVPPARVLFIDDREVNVQAARASGMRGLLHVTVESTALAIRR